MAPSKSKYGKLSRQPLSLVVAEFKYSPILKIVDHIPNIQEEYRKKYPSFANKHGNSINITPDGVQLGSSISWVFTSADNHKAIQIDHQRLVYFSTMYERFPQFCEDCIFALSVLKEVADPSLLDRIGLRYNDIIIPEEGESLETYMLPEFTISKNLKNISESILLNRTETVIQTDVGLLAIRTLIKSDDLAVMPDFHGNLPVKVRDDVKNGHKNAVLDFDHSWNAVHQGEKFSVSFAEKKLSELHHDAREAFWKITTDTATEKLWL